MTSAFSVAQEIHDAFDVPVFPVILTQDATTGKWNKTPSRGCKWRTQAGSPDCFNWNRAQGVGVPMGEQSGLFTCDSDSYKPGTADELEDWLSRHVLSAARVHRTASGGCHYIFQMPPGATFGNRAPKVDGLDVRGTGGFIVWADTLGRYSVERDVMPGPMPQSLVDELTVLNANAGSTRRIDEAPDVRWIDIDTKALTRRLERMVIDRAKYPALARRWRGDTTGMRDTSRSAVDMAVASLLARAGFSYDEIVWALLAQDDAGERFFRHGVAARDGWDERTERQARRAAWRAFQQYAEEQAEQVENFKKLARLAARPGALEPQKNKGATA